jgi:hypothetical protein
VRRQAEVAHQLSRTPQVDSIFNVPAGKDNLTVTDLGPQLFRSVPGRPSEPSMDHPVDLSNSSAERIGSAAARCSNQADLH